MFPDTDLPLALIMEEILEWEKKRVAKRKTGKPLIAAVKNSGWGRLQIFPTR